MLSRKYTCLAVFLAATILGGCAAKNTATSKPADNNGTSAEADKILYQKAMDDLKHSRFDVARLSLQTLINTYPDSEYLAKAKLAIADSYYNEGGSTGFTQAVEEYQDFITFFPFLQEASYAQMQIGMAHYRRMEKADRDRSEALEAEAAFQTFIQKYPNTELTPQAEQRLRDVQEVLAEGDYRVATFYFLRRADKAAAPRLIDLVNRYPLYSEADKANWMLGSIYERNEHNEVAATYYTRLVKEYPLSPLAGDAKAKLVKFGDPVPQPDPTAMARMQKEQNMPRNRPTFLLRPGEMLKSGPDVRSAARIGEPTLTPESDDATDTLTPGGNTSLSVVAAGGGATGGTGGAYVQAASGNASAPSGSGTVTATSDSPAPAASPAQPGQTDTPAAASADSGQKTSTSADQSTQSNQASNVSESSSKKKKKSKKQAPSQPQAQPQPQPQAQPQSQ